MDSNAQLVKVATATEIAERIRSIGDNLMEIARDLVHALDTRLELRRELLELGVNRELVQRLEKLGRGQIHPRLVFATSAAARKLIGLTLSEQTEVINEGIEVLESDEVTTRNIPFADLTVAQSRQVFAQGGARSISEQRTWLRAEKRKAPPVSSKEGYRVFKDAVVINKPGRFSKRLILQWLAEMN